MIQDFVNKKQRLNKKFNLRTNSSSDFMGKLSEGDDSWSFGESPLKEEGDFTLTQTLLMIFVGLPLLYFVLATLLAMTPNI